MSDIIVLFIDWIEKMRGCEYNCLYRVVDNSSHHGKWVWAVKKEVEYLTTQELFSKFLMVGDFYKEDIK